MRSHNVAMTAGLLAGVLLAPAGLPAQDNPVPLNYRNLDVTVHSVQNNRRQIVSGAKVTVTAEKPDPRNHVQFPLVKTSGRRGATFSKLPPSQDVGEYTITVEKDDCGEPLTQTRRMGGGGLRVAFEFGPCGQSRQAAQAAERRSQGGQNFDVTVELQDTSKRRYVSWVYLKQNGREVTKRRGTFHGNSMNLTFQNVLPGDYVVEIPLGRDKQKFDVTVPDGGGSTTVTIQ